LKILAALPTAEADLASCIARAHQRSRNEIEALLMIETFERCARDKFSLIKSALRLLLCVQRHGNNRDGTGGQRRFERGDGLPKPLSQNRGERADLFELEQVNQISKRSVIAAKGNGPVKRRMNLLAITAPVTRRIETRRDIARLTTDRAQ